LITLCHIDYNVIDYTQEQVKRWSPSFEERLARGIASGKMAKKRPNSRAKGRRNELKTKEVLVALGYGVIVTPSPSKFCLENDYFGCWDVIAVDARTFRCVQVKSNQGASPAKRKLMEEWVCPTNCTKEIWIWHDRVKVPEIRVWDGKVWRKETFVLS
jgi:hypothetical protein